MEALAYLLTGVAAAQTTAETVAKATAGLVRATERLAGNMVGGAVAFLRENGITPEELSVWGLMNFAANFQLEKFRFAGLLKKAPFVAPRVAAVEARLKTEPKTSKPNELRITALFLDVAVYARRHYLPISQRVEQIAAGISATEIPEPEDCRPTPASPEATACRDNLPLVKFVHHKTKVFVHQPKTMTELLAEPFLTEELAARVVHCAPKTLADKRRAGELAPTVLGRRVEEGTVLYHTEAWIAFNRPKAEVIPLPNLPKAGRAKTVSTELPDLPGRGKTGR